MNVIDVTTAIGIPDEMPLCPLCDNPIFDHEPGAVVTAFDLVAMAHEDCAEEASDAD